MIYFSTLFYAMSAKHSKTVPFICICTGFPKIICRPPSITLLLNYLLIQGHTEYGYINLIRLLPYKRIDIAFCCQMMRGIKTKPKVWFAFAILKVMDLKCNKKIVSSKRE